MGRFIKLIFQLVVAVILLFLCLAAVVVFDGLNDQGQKADCALVTGHLDPTPGHGESPGLDRVVKLYTDGEFPFVIVGGGMVRVDAAVDKVTGYSAPDEPGEVVKYLESHGVPSSAIIVAHRSESTQMAAQEVAEIMKSRTFHSVVIVTNYYHVTRVKLALSHEGVASIEKAHVGALQKEDALKIGREVVALCDFVGQVYLLPAAEKAKDEAKVGMDKASVDAEKAKEKVDKSLDNLAK